MYLSGTDPIEVCWLQGNKEITSVDPSYELVSRGSRHTLVIRDAVPDDAGRYTCEAFSEFGESSDCCDVVVKGTVSGYIPSKQETLIQCWCTTHNFEIFLYKPWRPKGFFLFETITNVLVSFFGFL